MRKFSANPQAPDVLQDAVETPPYDRHHDGCGAGAREAVKALTNDFRLFCDCTEADEQLSLLGQMQQRVKALRNSFAMANLTAWTKLSAAVSTLLFATARKPGFPTFSAFRTLADALDLLRNVMVANPRGGLNGDPTPIAALVAVADDRVRAAIASALRTQGLQATECPNPELVFQHLRETPFGVVFFDTGMTGLDEFTFTNQKRTLPLHQSPPVILLTGRSDFESRYASLLSETCDFIARPVVPSEVAVKALSFGLKHRIELALAPPEPTASNASPDQPAATGSLAEPSVETERRLAAERQVAQMTQEITRLDQDLAQRNLQLQQTQSQLAGSQKAQQSLHFDLERATRRETALQQESSALEQQIEQLNQTLDQTRQELAQESERRLAVEQEVHQLVRRVKELTLAENAAREQLDTSEGHRPHADSTIETERQLAAERQAQLAQQLAHLQKELASRTRQLEESQAQTLRLAKAEQTMKLELSKAARLETTFKEQTKALELQLAQSGESTDQLRQQLAQETERRIGAERQCAQAARQLKEAVQTQEAARQTLEHASRKQAEELARTQAALQKETEARQHFAASAAKTAADAARFEAQFAKESAARQKADQANAKLTATQARLEKQCAEARHASQKASANALAFSEASLRLRSDLRDILERQAQLDEQADQLTDQLKALGETLNS